jgi:hypothetical protein
MNEKMRKRKTLNFQARVKARKIFSRLRSVPFLFGGCEEGIEMLLTDDIANL